MRIFRWIKERPELLMNGILALSLLAMMGSLYYSNYGDPVANIRSGSVFPFGAGFLPCLLCWYARIFMYPIVLLSAVGVAKKDRSMARFILGNEHFDYVLALSLPGVLLSAYHYSLQKFHAPDPFKCSSLVPCTESPVNYLGFITIPLLGFVAFGSIVVMALLLRQSSKK